MRRLVTAIAAATLAAAAAMSPATASDPGLVAAAKKEGKLVLYTAMQRKVIEKSVALFEKTHGISVAFVRKGSGGIIQLVQAERETKNFKADVVDLWDPPTFAAWRDAGLFQPYRPEGADKLGAGFIDPQNRSVVASPVTEGIVYNTRAVPAAAAPKTFKDLLDPKWKGKLAHADPIYSGSATAAVNILVNLHGWDYYQQLSRQQPLIVQSIGAVPRTLLSGEAEVGVVAINADVAELIAKGEPLALVSPAEGTPYFTWEAAILKTASHPNAAKLWMDFLISVPHQKLLAADKYYPSRTDVAAAPESPPLDKLKLLRSDGDWLKANKNAQNEKFHEIMREAPKAKRERG